MKKAVILHGTEGSPEGNWFRWLEAQLQNKGYETWLPQLPHATRPSLQEWLAFVHENAPFVLDEKTIVIGHSSGADLALLIAQENQTKLKTVVCVSVFTNECGESVATEWAANARLFDVPFDWRQITANVENQIIILHSDDDLYVPLKQAEYIARQLDAELTIIPGQGHFNLEKSSEYSKNWYLLRILKNWGYAANSSVQVVDEKDQPLFATTKHDIWNKGLRHRVVRVMLENKEGKVLLQKRQTYLFPYPDCWDNSAAGHVDEGEDYLTAAKRELEEEIGLKNVPIKLVRAYETDTRYETARLKRFNRLYMAIISTSPKLMTSEREVKYTRWFTREELNSLAQNHPETMSDGLQEAYEIMYKSEVRG